jgi:hypothetical protein
MELPDVFRSQLAVSLISLAVGALLMILTTKLLSKRAKLRYSTRIDRLAITADDPIFGSVKVLWRDQPVRNLHMASVEIENTSNRDFENVEFKVYTGKETFLLNERTSIVGTPYIVKWSDGFMGSFTVAPGATPSASQWDIYNHSREYHVPVLNRSQVLQLSYFCTRPGDDAPPTIFVSTQLKGAKLQHQLRSNVVIGVPVEVAAARGLVVAGVVFVVCGLYLRSVWAASGISMLTGLLAHLFGAIEFKAQRWLRNLIAG